MVSMLERKKRCKNNFQTCVGELQTALVYFALLYLMFKYCTIYTFHFNSLYKIES